MKSLQQHSEAGTWSDEDWLSQLANQRMAVQHAGSALAVRADRVGRISITYEALRDAIPTPKRDSDAMLNTLQSLGVLTMVEKPLQRGGPAVWALSMANSVVYTRIVDQARLDEDALRRSKPWSPFSAQH